MAATGGRAAAARRPWVCRWPRWGALGIRRGRRSVRRRHRRPPRGGRRARRWSWPPACEATAEFLHGLPVQLLADVAGVPADFVHLLHRLGSAPPRGVGRAARDRRAGPLRSARCVRPSPRVAVATTGCPARRTRRRACRCSGCSTSRCSTPTRSCSSPVRWPRSSSRVARGRRSGVHAAGGGRPRPSTASAASGVWYRSSGSERGGDGRAGALAARRVGAARRPHRGCGAAAARPGGGAQRRRCAARSVGRAHAGRRLGGAGRGAAGRAGGRAAGAGAGGAGWSPTARHLCVGAGGHRRSHRARRPAGAGPAAPWPGSLPAPSPAVVHEPARPIVVLDADGRPVGVSGRGAGQCRHRPSVQRRRRRRGGRRRGPARGRSTSAGGTPPGRGGWPAFQVLTRSGRLLLVGRRAAASGGSAPSTADRDRYRSTPARRTISSSCRRLALVRAPRRHGAGRC